MNKPKHGDKPGPSRQGGMQRLEEDLVRILAVRVQDMARAAARRKERGGPLVDPAMEKMRWQAWEKAAAEQGLDAGAMRRLFSMVNDLAYAKARGGPAWKSSAMNLAPYRIPEEINLSGPGDLKLSRLWAAAAAASGTAASLTPTVMNDPLYELVQALAQAGAMLSRGEDAIVAAPGALEFGERTIFAGADEINLYILLSLIAPHPGRYTISGAGPLKSADLTGVAAGFARMGVRVTSIEPMSKALPLRVETPGVELAEFRLPENFPPDAALALAAAAPSYPGGVSLVWEPGWGGEYFIDEARALFRFLGVPAEEGRDSLKAPPGHRISGPFEPPLDPLLSAYALGLARTTGRRVRVAGAWPESSIASGSAELLRSAGLTLNIAQTAVAAEPSGRRPATIDSGESNYSLPLALALALALPDGAKIKAPRDFDRLAAEEFVNAFGSELHVQGGVLAVQGEGRPVREAFLAQSPHYALAALIASPARPGLRLVNPGVLSEVWPGVIPLYRTIFRASGAGPKENGEDAGGTKGRRIRL